MSIIKYKAKKSKSGYLYKVRIYRVIDGKRQDCAVGLMYLTFHIVVTIERLCVYRTGSLHQ